MISSTNLMRLARKWEKMAGIGRKRISLPRTNKEMEVGAGGSSSNKSPVAEKGHFVIYTNDQKRYVIPLMYLSNNVFLELFKLSEEEFGLSSDMPITLPCEALFMDYLVSLIKHGVAEGLQNAFLNSITSSCRESSATFPQVHTGQQSLICSY